MFYENVQALCKQHKTNITRMAKEIGLSNAASASWKKGAVPKLDTARKIADHFGVSLEYLMGDHAATSIAHTITAADGAIVVNGSNNTSSTAGARTGDHLTEMESELLRIFRSLDMRTKNCAMSYFYELEDQAKGVK